MMKRRDKGQVLVLVALALFVLLGMAALAVDVGFMFCTKNELQRSADAGALAGAVQFTLPAENWNLAPTRNRAESSARNFASRNPVASTPLDPLAEVAVAFPLDNQIRVDVSRNVDLFFSGIFGVQNRMITAYAVAVSTPARTVRLEE
jgi:uncharacterized membrane protein